MEKVKKFISGVWAKIKADLEQNLQATQAFIWSNKKISKVAKWMITKMTELKEWSTIRTNEWLANSITLREERHERRIERLKERRVQILSELAEIAKHVPEEKKPK